MEVLQDDQKRKDMNKRSQWFDHFVLDVPKWYPKSGALNDAVWVIGHANAKKGEENEWIIPLINLLGGGF